MPRSHRPAAVLAGLLLPLVLAACAWQAPPATPAANGPGGAPAAVTPAAQPGAPSREQAMALLRENKPLEAARLLEQLARQQNSTDLWSEASYAYLQGQAWDQALTAADTALFFQKDHPGALYNKGVALLGMHGRPKFDASLAIDPLVRSAALQPDRFEPHLELARAYSLLLNGPLAAYHVAQAQRLAPEDAAVKRQVETVYNTLITDRAPSEKVQQACQPVLQDGLASLCLHQNGEGYDLWLLPTGAGGPKPQRISLGNRRPAQQPAAKVQLPGGTAGYWLAANGTLVDEFYWRLFALKDGKLLTPVIFTGQEDPFIHSTSDMIRNFRAPAIQGDTIRATSRGADGKRMLHTTWRLAPDLTNATATQSIWTDGNK